MRSTYKYILDHSVSMALSAIEIYNKPSFPCRESVFVVLICTAWEALLKAKIVKDGGSIKTLYVKDGRIYKKNRNKEFLTVELRLCIQMNSLPDVVAANIDKLIRIRDQVVHLRPDENLASIVFSLGSANLRNYHKLASDWFDVKLTQYDFYILPLGFAYPFKRLNLINLDKSNPGLSEIVREITAMQNSSLDESNGFNLVCEIETALVSAKKVSDSTDLTVKVDNQCSSQDATVVTRNVNKLDRYIYTYTEAVEKIRKEVVGLANNEINDFIKLHKIKANELYSCYSFRSKKDELRGPQSSTPVCYNDDFIGFAASELKKKRGRQLTIDSL